MSFTTGVQSLVLQGRISEAQELVRSTYKGLLENNLELLFKLKCRQFVEMIGGSDSGEARVEQPSCHLEHSTAPGSPPRPTGEGGSRTVSGQREGEEATVNGQVSTVACSGSQLIYIHLTCELNSLSKY